mmetsp:Transcript_22230/g.48295  ORF Transcript_22230/g.48295 Transcript_22230/m.48295 type:complete len:601 (+) Transcript_22230:346-2148(+)|eukprot:CAMPEP_0172300594 /NCGR_PEP_ID=MMETSP1058-20130122/2647_1 /TAXON_ID=83371 /ORGANISM="Detonula confervacea, Strain CCMP 353" /LENGTH=600 /DNA_ID=CAMNT_0013010417 /DNA_START=252 /DNA_END=2054 /DNA_ORIENTATION=+
MADTSIVSIAKTPSKEKSPHITKVLKGIKEDLEDAEFPGLAGKVFNPVRASVLVPMTEKATDIIPAVVSTIPLPYLDEIGAFALSAPLGPLKLGYSLLIPRPQVDEEAKQDMDMNLVNAYKKNQKPKPILSSLMGVFGFAANSIIDIVTLPFNGKLGEWKDSTVKFIGYIVYSGVGQELFGAFADFNAFENLLIIARVQEETNVNEGNSHRARTAMDTPPVDDAVFKAILQDSARFARCATAAYGVSMISSADLLQVYGKKIKLQILEKSSKEHRIRKIQKYINMKEVISVTEPGASMTILGHFIALDKRKSQVDTKTAASKNETENGVVVLAIRGTYTVSGLKADAAGYTRPFCDGHAHAGIADRVNELWEHVKDDIVQALRENPGYNLVITGHSLGAGAAALLSLKLNYKKFLNKSEEGLDSVKVRCFAFAPPPVFINSSNSEAVTQAMSNTYAFIHENDCVPFLSIGSIRRLACTMKRVDDFQKGIFKSSPLMAAGLKPIPDELKTIIREVRDLQPVPNAQKLAIPAPFVMWMRRVEGEDAAGLPTFNAKFCRPQAESEEMGISDLSILLDKNMIPDHMNPQYEQAIYSVLRQVQRT